MIIIPVRIDVTMLMHPTYWDLFDIDIVVVGGLSPKPPVVLLPPPGTGLLAFRTAGGVPAPASVPPVLVLGLAAPVEEAVVGVGVIAAGVEVEVEGEEDEDEDDKG